MKWSNYKAYAANKLQRFHPLNAVKRLYRYPLSFYHYLRSDNPAMLQWGRLYLWIFFVTCVWVVKWKHKATDLHDTIILLSMCAIFGLAALIMLWENRVRTIRNLGLMSVFLGISILFGLSGLGYWGYFKPITERQLDVIRTLYIVGGIAVTIGLFNTVREWEMNRKHILYFLISVILIASLILVAV